MIKPEPNAVRFEKDSLTVFEKLLQGHNKAKESLAWESSLDNLIEKMTQLPTAPFPTKLMELFDYHYLVCGEDIATIIDKALVIREQMRHKQRYIRMKEKYYSLPFLPKNTYLKRLNVFNHEGELCYYIEGRIYLRLQRLLICLSPRRSKVPLRNLFAVRQKTVRLQDLEIFHYSPFLDLSTTNPRNYYDFFCDYYGKTQLRKYFNTKDLKPKQSEVTLQHMPKTLDEIPRLSTSQQVLWAYFFFRLIGLKLRINVEVAVITRFLLIITKNSLDNYKTTYFYKLLARAPYIKEDKRLITDLEIVKLFFQANKLPTADIENEIQNLMKK
ncbi:hypothetical protein [Marinilabilia sp.]|jgi:hypothetical protein|uniref:hypothetical protein n=1 Tax=Marinilabilia sp. TaxID=2021252 RepID=UPI0025B987BE|nr:hypothetical protein [Marinilabilia sp.]